ncbi:MAG: hypothetical protein Q9204_009367, partial [Flavoplaca sp. TL-2023a]
VDGTQSTGQLGKGDGPHAVKLTRDTLKSIWVPGSVCLFDLIEEVRPLLQQLRDDVSESHSGRVATTTTTTTAEEEEEEVEDQGAEWGMTGNKIPHDNNKDATDAIAIPPSWSISDPISEKKSVFVARCASIADQNEATSVLAHLLASDRKVAAATHSISAWRVRIRTRNPEKTGLMCTVQEDCDDDGETAAGGRLLHLMRLMDVWDVVVVVSRWYGGVRLGADRFRLINQAARQALVRGRFVKVKEENGRGKK